MTEPMRMPKDSRSNRRRTGRMKSAFPAPHRTAPSPRVEGVRRRRRHTRRSQQGPLGRRRRRQCVAPIRRRAAYLQSHPLREGVDVHEQPDVVPTRITKAVKPRQYPQGEQCHGDAPHRNPGLARLQGPQRRHGHTHARGHVSLSNTPPTAGQLDPTGSSPGSNAHAGFLGDHRPTGSGAQKVQTL